MFTCDEELSTGLLSGMLSEESEMISEEDILSEDPSDEETLPFVGTAFFPQPVRTEIMPKSNTNDNIIPFFIIITHIHYIYIYMMSIGRKNFFQKQKRPSERKGVKLSSIMLCKIRADDEIILLFWCRI